MMTEKEPEHLYQHNTYLYVIDFNKSSIYWSINIDCYFLTSGQRKSSFSEGKSFLSHYFPLESWNKKKF
jgi:hypothetical protein